MHKKFVLLTCLFIAIYLAAVSTPPPARGEEPFQLQERSIMVAGVARWYLLYLPPTYDGVAERPLLFVFHGAQDSMTRMAGRRTDLLRLAEENDFILVFPNGQDGDDNYGRTGWKALHCCPPAINGKQNDLAYIRQLTRFLQDELAIDRRRIYATGFSNGAMFTHLLVAKRPYVFAAAAPMSGTIGGTKYPGAPIVSVNPGAPVPIFLAHGTADPVVPYEGWQQSAKGRSDFSFAESVDRWVTSNQAGAPTRETIAGSLGDIHIERYTGGEFGADVTAVTFENLKHTWPEEAITGLDTSRAIFDFFLANPRESLPVFLPLAAAN